MSLTRAVRKRSSGRAMAVAGAALLALLTAYATALNAPFIFDDVPAIEAAAHLVQSGDLLSAFRPAADAGETTSGRPVVTLSLAFNAALTQDEAWSFRLCNLLIHALAALTLFGVVRGTVRLRTAAPEVQRLSGTIAAAVAVIWMLHPLQTASVTYVIQRAESLAGLLFLLTVYGFIRSVAVTTGLLWRTLSVAACLLGMATKETVVAAPLIVLLYDRTFVAGSFRDAWRQRRGYYLALASTWVVLAALIVSTGGRGGTAGFDADVSVWHYLLTQAHAVAHYLWLAVWPHPLVFDYGTELIRDVGAVVLPASILLLLGIATARELKRGSAAGFLGSFFFAALAPSSSFVPVASQTMAEHRMYLALIAPLVGLVWLTFACIGRRSIWVFGALALGCAVLTHARNAVYRSELTLWADVVAKRPANARAQHNLGLAFLKHGQLDAAIRRFETALRIQPDSADAHYNLGVSLARLNRLAEAIVHYERAVALRPSYAEAHNNLGTVLLRLERPNEARQHFERALQHSPKFAQAYSNLAESLLRSGDPAGALRQAREALRLRPNFAEAHVNAGNACAELQRFPEARNHYQAALQLDPDEVDALNNLGNVLIELGQLSEAIAPYQRALKLRPSFREPRRNLAFVLLHLGRPADALPHLEELTRTAPDDPVVREALIQARSMLRQ